MLVQKYCHCNNNFLFSSSFFFTVSAQGLFDLLQDVVAETHALAAARALATARDKFAILAMSFTEH